jgi:hypothetical protein
MRRCREYLFAYIHASAQAFEPRSAKNTSTAQRHHGFEHIYICDSTLLLPLLNVLDIVRTPILLSLCPEPCLSFAPRLPRPSSHKTSPCCPQTKHIACPCTPMSDTSFIPSSHKTQIVFALFDSQVAHDQLPYYIDILRDHLSEGSHPHQVSLYFLLNRLTFSLTLIALADQCRTRRALRWFRPLLLR